MEIKIDDIDTLKCRIKINKNINEVLLIIKVQ